MDAKPLRIRFDKVYRLIKTYDGIWYSELFNSYDINYRASNAIFNSIIWLKIRIDSCNSLPIEKNCLFIMLWHSLSQLLIRIKITTNITYFQKKKELILIKQANQKSAIYVTIGTWFLRNILCISPSRSTKDLF